MKTIENFPIQKLIVIGRFLFCLNLQIVYVFIDCIRPRYYHIIISWEQILQNLNKIWRCFLIYAYYLAWIMYAPFIIKKSPIQWSEGAEYYAWIILQYPHFCIFFLSELSIGIVCLIAACIAVCILIVGLVMMKR